MAFCSFSNEYAKNGVITIDSTFITEYLPEADGNAIRVYLYGLYACNAKNEISLESFAKALTMEESEVIDCFKFWEEYDIVAIISDEPFSVRYLPLAKNGKPRKFKPEKYTDFTLALQALVPDRMINTSEYTAYFNLMEEYSFKPEAMLMICKYCVDLKGASIGYKYVITVAQDFIYRGIVTVELIEKELSDYLMRSGDIANLLLAMGIKRKPEIEDLQLFNKWQKELGYDQKVLLYIAKRVKRKNVNALDAFIMELYGNKLFSEKEIEDYVSKKESYKDLARKICKTLSVYVEVIDPVVENYLSPWLAKGFDADTLEFVANYCFKKNKRSLQDMSEQITALYEKGLITLSSIAEYVKQSAKIDEFIKQCFGICGIDRRPNEWDRSTLTTWQNWGFSEIMILEACKLGRGATRPLVYVNAILSGWKAQGIFTPEQIPATATVKSGTANSTAGTDPTQHFSSERKYTKEELDALIDDVDDINF